jgi:hypothetical protein
MDQLRSGLNLTDPMKTFISLGIGALLALCQSTLAADTLQPGLVGEYFTLDDLLDELPAIPAEKKPELKRVDANINVDSTREAWPGTKLVDQFYIRWTGKLRTAANGSYTFFVESDDGSRLFIDGKEIVNNDGAHAMEEKSGTVELKPGDHDFKLEFYEKDLDAGCKFSWQPPGAAKQIVPASVLFHAGAEGSGDLDGKPGLLAEYYGMDSSIEDFPKLAADKKPTVKRVDKNVNFESTQEAWPGTDLVDHFYIRWTGKLTASKAGKYTLFLESDDGSRCFIDGKQVVNNGGEHGMEEQSGEVELTAGAHDLKIEFFENEVDAGCKFFWQPPGQDKEIVPATALSH